MNRRDLIKAFGAFALLGISGLQLNPSVPPEAGPGKVDVFVVLAGRTLNVLNFNFTLSQPVDSPAVTTLCFVTDSVVTGFYGDTYLYSTNDLTLRIGESMTILGKAFIGDVQYMDSVVHGLVTEFYVDLTGLSLALNTDAIMIEFPSVTIGETPNAVARVDIPFKRIEPVGYGATPINDRYLRTP